MRAARRGGLVYLALSPDELAVLIAALRAYLARGDAERLLTPDPVVWYNRLCKWYFTQLGG